MNPNPIKKGIVETKNKKASVKKTRTIEKKMILFFKSDNE
jgi:hypothetical protein